MSGQHILVVDDEAAIHQLISEILTDEGYQVKTAVSANEAEQHLQDWQPDMVLLDIWMPEMDGISLLKQWSENDRLHFPVVMMSGHGNIETAIEATRLGASDFIEKPISLAKLLQTTEQVLENHQPSKKGSVESSWPILEPLGNSACARELRDNIDTLAGTRNNVLFWGESGSGKFSLAYLLHNKRHNRPDSVALIDCLNCENIEKTIEEEYQQLLDNHGTGSIIFTNIDCLTEKRPATTAVVHQTATDTTGKHSDSDNLSIRSETIGWQHQFPAGSAQPPGSDQHPCAQFERPQ